MARQPKIAIVHDWLYGGGAEKVVEQLHHIYPYAPIYTSYCSDEWRKKLDNKVVTGYLQHWPFARLRRFLPLLRQWWFRSLDLSDFDIIISSSGNGEAKFVKKTREEQIHICYCHTPTHFYWRHYKEYLKRPSFRPYWLARLGLRLLVKPLKNRDFTAAQGVDHFIANSTAIAKDIKKFYGRESQIIFPPVNVDKFKRLLNSRQKITIPQSPRFIGWGRIVPMKRLGIAIETLGNLGWSLDIVGDGPDIDNLKVIAKNNVEFHGFVSDEKLPELINKADAFIFCAYEDFGIAPVEALAAGLPVVALGEGGSLDYIQPGTNGWFFKDQSTQSLRQTLEELPGQRLDARKISDSAGEFSEENFREKIANFVSKKWEER